MNHKVAIAFDRTEWDEVDHLARTLRGSGCWAKVGMELYYAQGPKVVEHLHGMGFPVFLDLKLHDIPNTVEKALANLLKLPIALTNVHAAGGRAMMEGARKALERSGNTGAKVIAVTQLTSTDQDTMNRELGIPGKLEDAVLAYAKLASEAGLTGVVCSPHEVAAIKRGVHPEFFCLTPGIRAAGGETHDQKRHMTAARALEQGSDLIVVGRQITQAPDPARALAELFKD